MATLLSPGVSVTVTDQSFYIPASATTVPLFILATRADKLQPDGITAATFVSEHSVIRTITSLNASVAGYGVPHFRVDGSEAPLHGDSRNEYGLFALNQYLSLGNRAYVVRADVDLADADVTVYTPGTPASTGTGDGTMSAVSVDQNSADAEIWTITCTNADGSGNETWSVTGTVSGGMPAATTGVPYNNGLIAFTINDGAIDFIVGDSWTINVTANVTTDPLGANDSAKRLSIVQALAAQINSNQDIRSELYEYNLILCPAYHEVVDELLALNQTIGEEAYVLADTPFNLTPEQTATWSLTVARQRSANAGYYYPHGLASNLDGVDVFCAASGIALKTITYSDNVAEIWTPAAGYRRGVVTGIADVGYITGALGSATTFVSTPINKGQMDVLYEFNKNVNPITFVPGRGIVVMGQKTSYSLSSALDRANVVRMLNKIKRDIRKASMAFLFELNDRITRESIKQMIDDYLNDIMLRRGLYDYVVQCDEQNNTAARIDRNELWVDIAIKPAKAVEFIYIPIRVVSTGTSI